MPLDAFLAERAADFAAGGPLVDQPFQARHLEPPLPRLHFSTRGPSATRAGNSAASAAWLA
jgi:hypothetical protein